MNENQIRAIIDQHGRLSHPATDLAVDDDLYAAGLTSHASVSLMLALEDAFDVEFPEHLLTRATFGSIASIDDALTELRSAPMVDAAASRGA